jgi:acyl-CoA dehydrogenase
MRDLGQASMRDIIELVITEAAPAAQGWECLAARTERVCAVARAHAVAVDAEGRFPVEAVEALKAERLLGIMVPVGLGGEGASLTAVADVCFALGRACGSSAMIFAMHQVKAACLIRHHGGSAWQLAFLRRLARDQLLLASSTTEADAGGAVRSSRAPVERQGDAIRLTRSATVVSYGEQADAIVTTARCAPDAAASDQVLAVFPRESHRLARTGDWDATGMRGTCSHAFALEAWGEAGQILPAAYADIHVQTMTVSAHCLWASVWAGVAADAVERARLFVRKAVRAQPDRAPPGAAHLAQAKAQLNTLCALVTASLNRYAAIRDQPEGLAAMEYQTAVSLLKVQASELAVAVVMSALRTCGLAGYRNDGDFSVSRHLRDVLSAPLMINNDRILADLGPAAMIDRGPATLAGGV